MALELLKYPDIKAKIQHCYLVFPTIERMAASSNGFWFTKVLNPLWFLLRFFIIVFAKLPVVIQIFIISVYFFVMSIPRTFLGTALKYSRLSIMEKVVYLANEEMRIVVNADIANISENKKLLKFYYGANDGWTPKKYCNQLIERVPGIDAQIDIYNIAHAFVLRSSTEMGKLVGKWVLECKRF